MGISAAAIAGVASLSVAIGFGSTAAAADIAGVWAPTGRNIAALSASPIAKPPSTQPSEDKSGPEGAAPKPLGAIPGAAAGADPGRMPLGSLLALRGFGGLVPPPYKPEWAARYQALLADAAGGKVTVDPTARCLPAGMPRIMTTPFPFEISIEKDRVLILFEAGGVRWIWTDGRKHPDKDDVDETFMGDSIGHWEGDSLVIDTVGLRGDTVFDQTGAGHSNQLHIVERLKLLSPDKMEDRMTIDDPVAFSRPWEVTRTYDREANWKIMEFVCEENNRGVSPDAPGPTAK